MVRLVLCAMIVVLVGCTQPSTTTGDPPDAGPAPWPLPEGFPPMAIPPDNPMTPEKVELGRHLFFDTRLSGDESMSCGSCHEPARAFSDGKVKSTGITGEQTTRNSMALINVGYAATYTWANPLVRSLEMQLLVPLFGEHPVELGLAGREVELVERLKADADYPHLFAQAFPSSDEPINLDHIAKAIASFERALLSGNAPWDRFQRGESDAVSAAAKRGAALFFSERLECYHCHGGVLFSDHVVRADAPSEAPFHNTGLYNVDGMGAYPVEDTGLHGITGRAGDMGRFKAPTLRNIAVTGPYMHDGSIPTLREAVLHYAEGGRTLPDGPNAGSGSESPLKDSLMVGFELTESEMEDVLAFLESLTDEEFLTNPAFTNPFETP